MITSPNGLKTKRHMNVTLKKVLIAILVIVLLAFIYVIASNVNDLVSTLVNIPTKHAEFIIGLIAGVVIIKGVDLLVDPKPAPKTHSSLLNPPSFPKKDNKSKKSQTTKKTNTANSSSNAPTESCPTVPATMSSFMI